MASADQLAGTTRPAATWALEQLLDLIAHGALGPGQQLPAERDLALQLGVSRNSIREAASALVSLGVLDPRHGAGVFVTSLEPSRLLAGLRLVLPVAPAPYDGELLEVQGVLEGAAAAAAAVHGGPEQARRLAELHEAVAGAQDPRAAADADREFHLAVGRLGGNAMLAALADVVLSPARRSSLWHTADGGLPREMLLADHVALIDAVGRRGTEEARAVWTAHASRGAALLRGPAPDSGAGPAPAQRPEPVPVPPAVARRRDEEPGGSRPTPEWFRDAKLGVLVHWGLYSVPGWAPPGNPLVELLTDDETVPHADDEPDPLVAHPFAEWYLNSLSIPGSPTWHYHRATHGDLGYEDFRAPFDAAVDRWDPAEWADLFAAAGARYAVPVAKHHDGYLMWTSGHPHPERSRWAAPRDVVGELASAVRERGMRLGIYYSSGMDWSFAHLPVRRMVDVWRSCPPGHRYAAYVDRHWRELIDRYEPSILWNDMGYPAAADAHALFRDYYRQVPDGVVTDRFRVGGHDVATPNLARRHVIDASPWEVARPLGTSFGWNRREEEQETLTGGELVHLLLDVVSKNGNLLLGVSPDEHGRIPDVQRDALLELGRWLDVNGEAVYGTRPWIVSDATAPDGTQIRFTTRDGDLFVHLLGIPGAGAPAAELTIPGLHLAPATSVRDLATGQPVPFSRGRRGSVLQLPPPRDESAEDSPARVLRVSPCPEPDR